MLVDSVQELDLVKSVETLDGIVKVTKKATINCKLGDNDLSVEDVLIIPPHPNQQGQDAAILSVGKLTDGVFLVSRTKSC